MIHDVDIAVIVEITEATPRLGRGCVSAAPLSPSRRQTARYRFL